MALLPVQADAGVLFTQLASQRGLALQVAEVGVLFGALFMASNQRRQYTFRLAVAAVLSVLYGVPGQGVVQAALANPLWVNQAGEGDVGLDAAILGAVARDTVELGAG